MFEKTDFTSYIKNAYGVGGNIIIKDEDDDNEVLEEVGADD